VDRLLESGQASPEQTRAHRRQAILSVFLGCGAWVAGVAAVVMIALAVAAGGGAAGGLVILLAFAVLLSGACAASIGVGQAVAAIRTRGHHMILATVGLALGGLYLGVIIGWFSFGVWAS
jgi:hypothetical protein